MSKQSFIIGHTQPRGSTEMLLPAAVEHTPVQMDIPTLLDTRMIVCANSGGGKSYLYRLIAERVGKRVPTWIIDPEGEYATLRELLDIAVVGGSGEIPLTVNSAALSARRLYESGIGAVFDLSDLDLDDKRAAVDRILSETLRVAKHPAHPLFIFLDEAHQLCPQVGQVESSQAIKRMMDSGRKREICGMLATQRVTKLHNDAIAEARNVAIGLTILGADQERAGDLLGMNKLQRSTLSSLKKGQFYLYGPAVQSEGVTFFKSDTVATTHPQPGQRSLIQVPPASEAMKKILAQLGDLPAQAQEEAAALESAQKEIARLQRELHARPVQVQVSEPRVEIQVVEKPVLNGELPRLEAIFARAPEIVEPVARVGDQLVAWGNELNTTLGQVRDAINKFQARPPVLPVAPAPTLAKRATDFAVPRTPAVSADNTQPAEGLTAPQQRILDALAEFQSLGLTSPHKSNVAVFAEQSPTSSGYQNNLGRLRTSGLIEYPGSGRVALTAQGNAVARAANAIRSLDDLHNAWLARLPRPQGKILQHVIAAYPHAVGKNDLAERAGQSATSSGYQNNLGALRSLGLLDYPRSGYVVATTLLFPDGLR